MTSPVFKPILNISDFLQPLVTMNRHDRRAALRRTGFKNADRDPRFRRPGAQGPWL